MALNIINTIASLLLVAMPFVPSSVLAPSSILIAAQKTVKMTTSCTTSKSIRGNDVKLALEWGSHLRAMDCKRSIEVLGCPFIKLASGSLCPEVLSGVFVSLFTPSSKRRNC